MNKADNIRPLHKIIRTTQQYKTNTSYSTYPYLRFRKVGRYMRHQPFHISIHLLSLITFCTTQPYSESHNIAQNCTARLIWEKTDATIMVHLQESPQKTPSSQAYFSSNEVIISKYLGYLKIEGNCGFLFISTLQTGSQTT